MIEDLRDRVVVITGAGKGIGYETAIQFAKHGSKIAVISRDGDDLERLRDEVAVDEEYFLSMEGDVSNQQTIELFVLAVYEKYGRIDCLVNNAGMRFRKSFLDISYTQWREVMDVNVGSTMMMSQAVIPYMKEQGYGRIINMASIVGTLGLPELSAYAASKGAIISLTKTLALEFAQFGIHANVIAPGFCETSYAKNFREKKELYEFTIERTPMRRWGSSLDIANTCIYLASSLSDYMTGEVLNVDGGWSAW